MYSRRLYIQMNAVHISAARSRLLASRHQECWGPISQRALAKSSRSPLNPPENGALTLNPAAAGIRAFRPIAPQGLGCPARPCPTRSTKRA